MKKFRKLEAYEMDKLINKALSLPDRELYYMIVDAKLYLSVEGCNRLLYEIAKYYNIVDD